MSTAQPSPAANGAFRALKILLILIFMLVLGVVGAAAAGVGVHQYVYSDRIHMGVRAAGMDLGGLTRAQAADTIRSQVPYFDAAPIKFSYQDKTWQATPAQLGGLLPADTLADEAYSLGRSGDFKRDLLAQLALARYGVEIPLRSEMNRQAAAQFVAAIAREVDRPARNAALSIRDGKVVTESGQEGWEVDQADVLRQVEDRVLRFGGDPIAVPIVATPPLITDVSAAKATTERLISGPVTVTFQDKKWTLPKERIAEAIVFYQEAGPDKKPRVTPRVREDLTPPFVDSIAPQINREMVDAKVRFDGQRMVALAPSVVGYTMNVEETLKKVNDALMATERTVPAVVEEHQPSIDSNNLDAMGVKEVVVRGTTQFKGSPPERIQNIKVAASKFQDVMVPPGGTFSFAEHLGDVTAAEGYVEALIIVGDRTETDYGGGVCQVSTTAFRAAFYGGYPIVERTAHAYRVSYYEEGVGPGLDATVFTPWVDFKFKNDQPTWLVMRTEFNAATATLSFVFYGTRPNREVVLEGPRILKETPAKPARYQVDAKMKAGEVKQVDWAHPGAEVVATRIVREPGQPERRDTFRSVYQPWGDIFLVGKGDPRAN